MQAWVGRAELWLSPCTITISSCACAVVPTAAMHRISLRLTPGIEIDITCNEVTRWEQNKRALDLIFFSEIIYSFFFLL